MDLVSKVYSLCRKIAPDSGIYLCIKLFDFN